VRPRRSWRGSTVSCGPTWKKASWKASSPFCKARASSFAVSCRVAWTRPAADASPASPSGCGARTRMELDPKGRRALWNLAAETAHFLDPQGVPLSTVWVTGDARSMGDAPPAGPGVAPERGILPRSALRPGRVLRQGLRPLHGRNDRRPRVARSTVRPGGARRGLHGQTPGDRPHIEPTLVAIA